jgi:hypothetical protein
VGDLFGKSVAETGLVAFFGQVGEGKDGDGRGRSAGRPASSAAPGDPRVQFVRQGVYGAELLVLQAAYGEAFVALPSLDGARAAAEIGGDFLPGVEAAGLRPGTRDGARHHLCGFFC